MLKTITSFCGADFVVKIGDTIYGEVRSLEYDSRRDELTINFVLFNTISEIDPVSFNGQAVTQLYANEYGDNLVRHFYNLSYIGEKYASSVDDTEVTISYVFECSYASRFEKVTPEILSMILGTEGK